jgi:2-desacetyl-2-hydroxyethyl bacteriochlorophyllide A dehydrogenase
VTTNDTIVFEGTREVSVEERAVPSPGPTGVLIETERTLISTGTELTVLSGEAEPGSKWDDMTEYPFVPGYNNVGVVVETGDDVTSLETGQRVATTGSHCAYTVADVADCRSVPSDISADEAVFFTIAEIVSNGVRRSDLTWGEGAVMYGLGLLGQLATRICQAAGARPVVGVDLAASRLDYLPDAPGVVGVDPSDRSPDTVLEDMTGRLADVVFEVTGNPDVITTELEALREQGRFVVLSSPKGETAFDFHDYCNGPSYRIIGAHNSSHPPTATPDNPWTQHRHCELFFEYLSDGSFDVESLISHRRHYSDAPTLYEMLLTDRTDAMGVVLEW